MVQGINGCLCFHRHADVWMQNKHLELKQEGLFLAGKSASGNLKASISLSFLLAETFLKLGVRQSWLKLMKWSGKQNVHLKIEISGPLANPVLQAKLCIFCMVGTNCSHKTKCKNTAVPPIHEIPGRAQKHLFRARCFSPHSKGLEDAAGFVQTAWGSLYLCQSQFQTLTRLPWGTLSLWLAKPARSSHSTGAELSVVRILLPRQQNNNIQTSLSYTNHSPIKKSSGVNCSHMPQYRAGYLKHKAHLIKRYCVKMNSADNKWIYSNTPCIRRHLALWRLSWYYKSQLTSGHWHK